MHIVGAVLLCIALGYFRIWLVQHIFFKEKKKFSLALLATSVFLVASLYCFELVMQRIFPDLEVSLPWFGYFLLYCALIFLFLLFLNKNYQSKHLWFLFCVRLIMFAIVGVLGFKVGMGSIVIYYLISAYAEEFLKI
ncbi:MAG: hypothetical protein LBO09_00655 [Candidatus Peribacteria bacterium]|jgi:hypothetical protein|nr:hypothetical protein [Candidatus Peribacteria bacterium]